MEAIINRVMWDFLLSFTTIPPQCLVVKGNLIKKQKRIISKETMEIDPQLIDERCLVLHGCLPFCEIGFLHGKYNAIFFMPNLTCGC